MITLPGYRVIEILQQGGRTVVARALREADGRRVVLKANSDALPSPSQRAALEHELEVGERVSAVGVIQYLGAARHGSEYALVLEDIGGSSLQQLVPAGGLPLRTFLDIAVSLADAVASLHAAGLAHKDMSPGNVVYNGRTGELRIIDLQTASPVGRQDQQVVALDRIEGTLAYLAPEQTGRTSRAVDLRADLYGMGGVLTFLLTGAPPFGALADPLELIYAHLARIPDPVRTRRPDVPPTVDAILRKLLSKSPEDRYRSAIGAREDLSRCRQSLADTGAVPEFELGTRDVSSRFQVPHRLYGRTHERRALLDAFARAASGPAELVLVAGWSGIGKTSLVLEVERPIAEARGTFASGKLDQFARDRPYAALAQAFGAVVEQWLSLPDEVLSARRERVAAALGVNGRVLVELVPALELLLGKQDPVPELGGQAAERRFRMVLGHFLSALATADHPLVLFLDDLQWADGATLDLITGVLLDPEQRHLLILGGYRDNEVDDAHPLAVALNTLEHGGARVTRIALGPLPESAIAEMVADALGWTRDEAATMAALCSRRTGGNPFFLHAFLHRVHQDGHLVLDAARARWRVDLDAIAAAGLTDNIVELVASRIRELDPVSVDVLVAAAVLGNRFDVARLAEIRGSTPDSVAALLEPAVAADLLIPDRRGGYRFVHDRVQQAAASLVDADTLARLHLTIGRHLTRGLDASEDGLFEVVDHLEHARPLLSPDECTQLARLTLRAATRAVRSMAYKPALRYADLGLSLLGEDPWTTDTDLALGLHGQALEAAYSSGRFDVMTSASATIREHARGVLERVRVDEIEIQHFNAQQQPARAVERALETLALLGEPLYPSHSKVRVVAGLFKLKWQMRGMSPEQLIDLPRMTEPHKLACMRILSFSTTSAYYARPDVLPFIIYKMVELSLSYGNSPYSPNGWIGLALVLCGPANDIDGGFRVGRAAVAMEERFGSRDVRARVYFPISIFVTHWKEHIRTTLPTLLDVYRMGLDVGDVEYAALGPQLYVMHLLLSGSPLPHVAEEAKTHLATIHALNQRKPFVMTSIYAQYVENLRHPDRDLPVQLLGTYFDVDQAVAELEAASDGTSLSAVWILTLALHVQFGDIAGAAAVVARVEEWLQTTQGTFWIPFYHQYRALAALDLAAQGDRSMLRLGRASERMLAQWARHAPMNHAHRHALVAGQARALKGDVDGAIRWWDESIASAREHGFTQVEAEACERAGRTLLAAGQERLARSYLVDARDALERWGASAKLRQFVRQYDALLPRRGATTTSTATITTSSLDDEASTTLTIGQTLDLSTVLHASQVLSTELRLPNLLRRMLAIALQGVGAESGALVLLERGRWVVQAEGTRDDTDGMAVLQGASLEASDRLSAAMVRLVTRTGHPLVLDDASADERFGSDPHVVRVRARSVLCVPLRKGGTTTGVLYLENNLQSGAFTPARLKLLEMVGAQAVISLENARLYEDMTALNAAYGRFVPVELLGLLGRESIIDVQLGDSLASDMAVLFTDIRGFTSASEQMSAQDAFRWINGYLRRAAPAVTQNGGIIDKYIGDAIMAFFPRGAAPAVAAAIDLRRRLSAYNEERVSQGRAPLDIGIGIHIGPLLLGTVGHEHRLNTTVIGDTVNVASRLEGLTKRYGTPALVSGDIVERLADPDAVRLRAIDEVRVRGRKIPLALYEVIDALPPAEAEARWQARDAFRDALAWYRAGRFEDAAIAFDAMAAQDAVSALYATRARAWMVSPPPSDWEGIHVLE